MDNFHNNIPIIQKYYELYRINYQWLKNFPKKERYSLGEKIELNILDAMAEVYHLNPLPNALKESHLLVLQSKNELLKIFFRLGLDVKVLDFNKYSTAVMMLQENSKMIGGWIKFIKEQR